MKAIITIVSLLFSFSSQAQVTYYADVPVQRQVIKVKHFEDLTDREKWLLLEKIEDAYFTFNKKELEPSTLLAYMESENPIVEWTGKHEEGEDKKMIRYYTVDRKHILNIFDL